MTENQRETKIHPTAVLHPTAELGSGVEIGPYCVIGEDVQIGDGTSLKAHVVIERNTRIGRNCQIWYGAALGGQPQDVKFRGEHSLVVVGDNNIIREYVTIHRATGESNVTRLGHNNMLMAYAHVGHNVIIGDGNMISSYVGFSGHVVIEDNVVFGGMVGIHQFVRIGKLAMVGGFSKINRDVPPFMVMDGVPARVLDVNRVGLRRHGVPAGIRASLRHACKLLYHSGLNTSQALETIEDEVEPSEEVDYLISFIRSIKDGYGGRQNDLPH